MTNHRPLLVFTLWLAGCGMPLAAASTAAPLGDPAAYRLGLDALAAARMEDAVAAFESVKGILEPWARVRKAQALLARGEAAKAAELLATSTGASFPEAARGMALDILAACRMKMGFPAEAAATLERALQQPRLAGSRARSRGQLADYWFAAGEEGKAYLALIDGVEQPGESTGLKRDLQRRLLEAQKQDRVTRALPPPERVRWAKFLASKGLVPDALRVLAGMPAGSKSDSCKTALLEARWQSQLGQRDEAAIRLSAFTEDPAMPMSCRSEALAALARIQTAGGDVESTRATLQRLLALDSDSGRAATARVELAELDDKTNRKAEAEALRRFVVEKQAGTSAGAAFLWERAFSQLLAKKFDEAVSLLDAYLAENGKSRMAATVRYWRAVAWQKAGKGPAELAKIAQDDGAGMFRVLARTRLKDGRPRLDWPAVAWPGGSGSARTLPPPLPLEAGALADTAAALSAARAWEELALLLEQARRKCSDCFPSRFALARTYETLGMHQAALQVAEETASARLSEPDRDILQRLVHPIPFETAFVKTSAASGISPYLAFAIAREESRFQPDNRSWADARGLMQLLPSTAKWLAEKQGVPGFTPERLYEPGFNIELGVRYLAYLQQMFKGRSNLEVLVMAAYNGGPGNVQKWLKQFGTLPADEFIEKIPLEETRTYVKKVSASLLAYEGLYGAQPVKASSAAQPPAARPRPRLSP